MKQYLLITTVAIFSLIATAQKNKVKQTSHDIAIHFNSICCGTPSDTFLKTALKNFNKANKVKVSAYIVSGCGREGEFKILLSYAGMSPKTCAKLKAQLDTLIPKQNASNKAANASSGNIDLRYNPVADDWQGCRVPMAPWKY